MNIKGSQTAKNINSAFAGEAIARARYSVYAQGAMEEGREDIADLFNRMADNEKEHSKLWYHLLHDGYGTCKENLQTSSDNEREEWGKMYPDFARIARDEGFEEIATLFDRIAAIEYDHERRFTEALMLFDQENAVEALAVTQKAKVYCMFCGNSSWHQLDKCTVCGAKDAYIAI